MIRVLIVDDEILVRQGIKTMVDWNKYGFEIVEKRVMVKSSCIGK